MPIPAYFQPGFVSIYGVGDSNASVQGIKGSSLSFLFGVVDQSWAVSPVFPVVGQSVMFKKEDVVDVVLYSNWPYTILPEDKIILVEQEFAP